MTCRAWPQREIENQCKGKETGDQAEDISHGDKALKTGGKREQCGEDSQGQGGELPTLSSSNNDGLNIAKVKALIGFRVSSCIDAQHMIFAQPKARASCGKSDKTSRTPACPGEALIFLLCH